MKTKYLLLTALFLVFVSSCKKEWLEEKRDISIIVPSTLKDLRLMLSVVYPLDYDTRGIAEISSDDFFIKTTAYNALFLPAEKRALIWDKEIWGDQAVVSEWNDAYQTVLYSNVILETLEKIDITENNRSEYNSIKGAALFFRSKAFYNLVIVFAKQYDPVTATNDLGIPLRLKSDINQTVTRASVAEVYEKIIIDLNEAASLLPSKAALKTDACKLTVYGLLARCYLSMNRYPEALGSAVLAYQIHSFLIDYNTLNSSATYPLPTYGLNDEIHNYTRMKGDYTTISPTSGIVEPELYSLYEGNDLRKTLFFQTTRTDGEIGWRGNYLGIVAPFGGTATDEILLIMAECKARKNDVSGALADINTLLVKRYKTGTYVLRTAANQTDALLLVLSERRKELARRGLRWFDLKRLNIDPLFAKTLTRTVNGEIYKLPPNDPRYVFPIPDYIIQYNGIQQNIR